MGMSVGSSSSKEPEPLMEINTTPLIDVMLVLLVMLIITIPIQTHAVKLNMPVGNPPPPDKPPEIVQIDVDFDGSIIMNGLVIASGNVGKGELDERLQAIAAMPDQPEVHLRPNRLVNYGRVMTVMAAAQRFGVTKIGIVGNEQFVK